MFDIQYLARPESRVFLPVTDIFLCQQHSDINNVLLLTYHLPLVDCQLECIRVPWAAHSPPDNSSQLTAGPASRQSPT